MHKLLFLSCLGLGLSAADLTVGPVGGPVAPAQTLTVPITLTTGGEKLAALQFNLLFDTANLTVTSKSGAAAAAAQKSAIQSPFPGGAIFLVLGTNPLDLTPMADGTVVELSIKIADNTPPGRYSLTLSAVNGSGDTGIPIAVSAVNSVITLEGAPRAVRSLSLGAVTVPANFQQGISVTVAGDLIATDTIAVQISGEIGIGKINDDSDNQLLNAAGVFTTPGKGGCLLSEEALAPAACIGALLIGNDSLGYFPLVRAAAASGLGNRPDAVPTTFTLRATPLSAIFGPNVALADGTTLFLKVNDKVWDDNTGSFELSASCAIRLSASGAAVSIGSASARLSLAIADGCSWTVDSSVPWLRITNGTSGTGSGVITYSVLPNNGLRRGGELRIAVPGAAPVLFLVSQAAAGSIFSANIRNLNVPDGLVIASADTVGTGFVVLGEFVPNDTFSITVNGLVSFSKPDQSNPTQQLVNAAGVFTNPEPGQCLTTNKLIVPTACNGALLIGNNDLGYRPIFAPTFENGFNSPTPPTTLSHNGVPLSVIFGDGVPIPSGTVLFLKLNDSTFNDNSGAFRTGPPNANPNPSAQ